MEIYALPEMEHPLSWPVGNETIRYCDEAIKGEMAGNVFENVETATYAVLISAADDPGDASQSSLRANLA